MGASSLSDTYYLAEGTTRSGFEEWITIQNPNASQSPSTPPTCWAPARWSTGATTSTPAGAYTVFVPDEVGTEQDVSVSLAAPASDFLAERPMYFDYSGMGGWNWTGGHCVVATDGAANDWFFAEGYTGYGFEEWLCIQNPGDADATVAITYYPRGEHAPFTTRHTVTAHSRYTVMVNYDAGADNSISARIISDQPVICERPMYFVFQGKWNGGFDVMGFKP